MPHQHSNTHWYVSMQQRQPQFVTETAAALDVVEVEVVGRE